MCTTSQLNPEAFVQRADTLHTVFALGLNVGKHMVSRAKLYAYVLWKEHCWVIIVTGSRGLFLNILISFSNYDHYSCWYILNNNWVLINSLGHMWQVFSLQFIVGCVQTSSNEITLLETDSADYITAADGIWDCVSAVCRDFRVWLKSVLQICLWLLRTVKVTNAVHRMPVLTYFTGGEFWKVQPVL